MKMVENFKCFKIFILEILQSGKVNEVIITFVWEIFDIIVSYLQIVVLIEERVIISVEFLTLFGKSSN